MTRRGLAHAIAGSAIALLAVYTLLSVRARPAETHPFFHGLGDPPIAIAHRGSALLWPENTLYAFEQATLLGAQMVELDLRTTADSAIVVLHDPTVDRTTDGTGPLNRFTLERLRGLNAAYQFSRSEAGAPPEVGVGSTIPTLDEVFTALPATRLNLEIKEPGDALAIKLCAKVRAHNAQQRVLVASFHASAVRAFRRECPEVATSATFGEALVFLIASYVPGTIYVPPANALQLPTRFRGLPVINPRMVRAAATANLPVYVFTINDPGRMQHLFDLGVHGVVTDRPDLALELRQ